MGLASRSDARIFSASMAAKAFDVLSFGRYVTVDIACSVRVQGGGAIEGKEFSERWSCWETK